MAVRPLRVWNTATEVWDEVGDARLLTHTHDAYLTEVGASALFLTPATAAATYLTPAAGDALFLTPAEGATATTAALAAHTAAGDPHAGYATDADLAAHAAAGDPHGAYLLEADAAATYLTPAAGDALFLTPAEGDARYATPTTLATAVSAHAAAGDPHPSYLTHAEGDALYVPAANTYAIARAGGSATVNADGSLTLTPVAGAPTVTVGAGTLRGPNGTAALPTYAFTNDADTGLWLRATAPAHLGVALDGVTRYDFNVTAFTLNNTTTLGWGSGDATTAADLTLTREAADTLALRRTTTAQTLRLYKTWTDASNYERGALTWAAVANTLRLGAEAAGTGTVRPLSLGGLGTSLDDNSLPGATALTTGAASRLRLTGGTAVLETAPSVAAGAAQTFAPRLAVDATGLTTVTPDGGANDLNGGRGYLILGASGTARKVVFQYASAEVTPSPDNTLALGHPSARWTVVYAVNGTIQTSDVTQKDGFAQIDPADALAAVRATPVYEFTYTGHARRSVSFIGQEAHPLLSADGVSAEPQRTASIALAALAEVARRLELLEHRAEALETAEGKAP
jgi:hypothetical protein